ncbi:MAG: hypothetical protein V1709_03670 [Planctomycetota bacterium]
MCTIGAVYNKSGKVLAFKTVDIRGKWQLPDEPVMQKGDRYKYLRFATNTNLRKPGLWAGVNEKGVILLGADALAIKTFPSAPTQLGKRKKPVRPGIRSGWYGGIKELMVAYAKVIGAAATAKEGVNLFIQEYQKKRIGMDGDIVMLVDRQEAVAIEYSLNEWGLQFFTYNKSIPIEKFYSGYKGEGFCLIRTNFFLVLRHMRYLPQENTLHLSASKRYERALELLSKTTVNTTVDNLKELCCDHYPEPSGMSICRHGGENEYKTHGSVIIELTRNRIETHYNIDTNPCESEYQVKSMRITK